MTKQKMVGLIAVVLVFVFYSIAILKPSFNSGPGCDGSGCHVFQDGLVTAALLDSIHIEVTVDGVTAGKPVAGELVDSAGTVVSFINSTHTNPFILTATHSGTYRINAGFKSPSKKWDSTMVTIQQSHVVQPDTGWNSKLAITEVMFDVPQGLAGDANGDGIRGYRSDEFVEIFNKDTATIDLSGYQILDREGIAVFTFPAGAQINPGQFAVVFGAVGTAGYGSNIPPGTALFAVHENTNDNVGFDNGQGKTNFSNSRDCVVLVNPAAADTLWEVYWGSASPVTSKPIYLGYPNTISGGQISGSIRQSVTHFVDSLLWDKHTVVSGDTLNLFSPGSDVFNLTAIKKNNALPLSFELFQNYPNPFNPGTKIRYRLLQKSFVELSIYNNLGQKIRTLVSSRQTAGMHTVLFQAGNLSSGIYFYRLKTGTQTEIKKMILIR